MSLIAAVPAAAAPSLLHVGDSLAVGSDLPLRHLLPTWAITSDVLKNRTTSVGVAIIDRQPSLPGSLVVELGTNDSPDQSARFAGYVRHVLQLAGPKRCVVWVNIHRPPYNGVSYAGFNRVLDQIAGASSNLAVVDWNGMVNSGQAEVAGDGVHSTPSGYQARAAAIAQALEGCSSQQSPSGSHTIAPAKNRHAARPKRHAKPKPKPRIVAKQEPIKVYTPKASASHAAKPAAHEASGTSAGVYVLLGALGVLLLGGAGYALARRRS